MEPHRELNADELEFSISEEKIRSLKTIDNELFDAVQQRAADALHFGTRLRKNGYNIFVTGSTGTGRHTAVKKILDSYKNDIPLKDIICVFNFTSQETPGILYLPAGRAAVFKNSLSAFMTAVKKRIRSRLESEIFKKQRNSIIKKYDDSEKELMLKYESSLALSNFMLVNSKTENDEMISDIMPAVNGKPADFEELQQMVNDGKLTEVEFEKTRSEYFTHLDDLQDLLRKMQHNKIQMEDKLLEMEKQFVEPIIRSEIEYLIDEFPEDDARKYFAALINDILERLYLFIDDEEDEEEENEDEELRYDVNILVDNTSVNQAPVIFETYPTPANLFGTIETKIEHNVELKTSFMMVKAGSVIKASGGFLIINAEELFQEENSWENLKRVLKRGEVQIQHQTSLFNPAGAFIKPEPVKIDTKIIIIGNENLYDMLYDKDEEFEKLFKVPVEFDSEMPVNDQNIKKYISFIHSHVDKKTIREITDSGIQAVLDYGLFLTGHRNKLSARFSKIRDLIIESDYWAGEFSRDQIERLDVETAVRKRNHMSSLPEEKLTAMMQEGTIRIEVTGFKTGVINGIALYDRGYYTFGRPFLISATAAPGDEGIVNIEREAGLSGEIYNKGVMIIEGFLRSCYGRSQALSVFASICFEQSYGEIEGDSASSTEIFALLSAISGVPIRQDIAVTGSVNQLGEIQPIGGVNEKVEGFYSICSKFGLTGRQGVIIPQSNIKNLVLCREVIEAVRSGTFHIYPIRHINDGIEILSGLPAGLRDKKGSFPSGTFNNIVEKKLKELSGKSRLTHN